MGRRGQWGPEQVSIPFGGSLCSIRATPHLQGLLVK